MKYLKLILFPWFLSLLINFDILSQDVDCKSSLEEAQKLFNQGMIDQIEKVLKPCIEKGFNKSERTEAYKLIIIASLLDGDQAKAENNMFAFLRENPEYEVLPSDPVEFVYLFETYRTKSFFSIGFIIGPNFSDPRIIESYSAGDLNNTISSNKIGAGYHVGLSANRLISKHMFLNLDLIYHFNTYQFRDKYKKLGDYGAPDYDIVTYKEELNRIELPLSFGFQFQTSSVNYYFKAGAGYSYLLNANGTPSKELEYNSEVINGATKSVKEFRNSHLFSGHAGIGIQVKIPHGYLLLDGKLNIGLNSLVNMKDQPNDIFLPDFLYLDDDFSLNSLSFSVGYFFSFYQAKKD